MTLTSSPTLTVLLLRYGTLEMIADAWLASQEKENSNWTIGSEILVGRAALHNVLKHNKWSTNSRRLQELFIEIDHEQRNKRKMRTFVLLKHGTMQDAVIYWWGKAPKNADEHDEMAYVMQWHSPISPALKKVDYDTD